MLNHGFYGFTDLLFFSTFSSKMALLSCFLSFPGSPSSFSLELTLYALCFRSGSHLVCQAALAQHDFLPNHELVICADDSVSFSFGKGYCNVLESSLCGAETILSIGLTQFVQIFLQSVGHFVSFTLLSAAPTSLLLPLFPPFLIPLLCSCNTILFSVFPFYLHFQGEGTVHSFFLLCCQATVGTRSLISYGK